MTFCTDFKIFSKISKYFVLLNEFYTIAITCNIKQLIISNGPLIRKHLPMAPIRLTRPVIAILRL